MVKRKTAKKQKIKKVIMKKYLLLIILFSVLVLLCFIFFYAKLSEAFIKDYIKMDIKKIEYTGDSSVIYLKNNCLEFSFYTTADQGESIEAGLYNISSERPVTHDIIIKLIEKSDLKPVMVRITKISGSSYYGELVLEKWLIPYIIDIRPSDAVAIAVRSNTPIYVNKNLVKNVCEGFIF